MRSALALTAAALLLTATPALADDATIWKARVAKAAPKVYNLSTAPVLCYCPGAQNRVGQLLQGVLLEDAQTYTVTVECVVPLVSFTTGDVDTNAVVISCTTFTQLLK